MKKLFAMLFAAVMLLSVAGCTIPQLENTPSSAPQREFSLGTITDRNYENKFIGIGCNLDVIWNFYTDAQIRELNNQVSDIAGEEFQELMKNADVVYDMMAVHNNKLDNVIVNMEKVNPVQLAALDISANYEKVFPTIKSTFEKMGYSGTGYTLTTVTIGGQEYPAMAITARISGMDMYQILVSIKCNGYLAGITVTTYKANRTSQILDDFYLIP